MNFLFSHLVLLGLVASSAVASFNRSSFPSDFVFGLGSSAYQYEGAANEDGRGPSIWDTFTHNHPEKIKDGTNADVSADMYHRYKEDIKLLKDLNVDAFRLSVSWSRILPNGSITGGVNQKGIEYYNNFINELLANGIQPFVTLFHWDLPQALEDEYRGFLSPLVVNDFREYANICFKYFGDRVKYWSTMNEPWILNTIGYALGTFPPNHCSMTESLVVSHHQVLAHAAAVNLYKQKYQATQKGKIGVTILSDWVKPYISSTSRNSNAHSARKMVQIALDFIIGSFLDPLTTGDYPKSMKKLIGDKLPEFTKEQSKMIQEGSFDFLGLNYYSTFWVEPNPVQPGVDQSKCTPDVAYFVNFTDEHGQPLSSRKGVPNSTYIYPKGLQEVLKYVNCKYKNPIIYIMENGKEQLYSNPQSVKDALYDNSRIYYIHRHLSLLKESIKDGVNVKGYFVWSLLDAFEWTAGHTAGCGLYYVDYKDNLKRYPKLSAHWFKNFLRK